MASFSWIDERQGMYIGGGDGLDNYTGDFTVEGWYYKENVASWWCALYVADNYAVRYRTAFLLDNSGGTVGMRGTLQLNGPTTPVDRRGAYYSNSNSYSQDAPIASTWTHWAYVKENEDWSYYQNGVRVYYNVNDGTGALGTVNCPYQLPENARIDTLQAYGANMQYPTIGGWNYFNNYGGYFGNQGGDSYMDQIRVSTVARYSGAEVQAPTAAFSTDGNTTVLIQSDNWDGSSATLTATTGGTITLWHYTGSSNITNDWPNVEYAEPAGFGVALSLNKGFN